MTLTLVARHRNNKLRRLHVTDIASPAERCMVWIENYRLARENLAFGLRYPTEYDAAMAEDDMAYAAAAFKRDRERLRAAIRNNVLAQGEAA